MFTLTHDLITVHFIYSNIPKQNISTCFEILVQNQFHRRRGANIFHKKAGVFADDVCILYISIASYIQRVRYSKRQTRTELEFQFNFIVIYAVRFLGHSKYFKTVCFMPLWGHCIRKITHMTLTYILILCIVIGETHTRNFARTKKTHFSLIASSHRSGDVSSQP